MELTTELYQYFVDQFFMGKAPENFDNDYNLIDNSILDSLAVMKLVGYVEETYKIEFGDGDIVPEHLGSVKMLADFIRKKNR